MSYKVSIRAKLTSYFLSIVLLSSIVSAVFAISHILVIKKYQHVQSTIFLQYRLIEATDALVAHYNVYRSTASDVDLGIYEADKKNIQDILVKLDKGITEKDSRALLSGVEKTLENIISETDQGVKSLQSGDLTDTATRYSEAYRKFTFAEENITNLILKEVGYGQQLEAGIQRTDRILMIFGGLLFASIVFFLIILSVFLSGSFVTPLTRLTLLAESIANGDLEKNVDKDLLERRDEFGSLAGSFSSMVESLREGISALKKSNAASEKQNKELEKLNNFMIDREIKMIELKKRIQELEGKSSEEVS